MEVIFKYESVFDVIIVGGGVSGTVAAIAAGRCGAKVLLIEQRGYLGGALTGCGVGPMMTFYAGEKQIIKGIMEEIVQNLIKRGYSSGHVKDTTRYISYLTPFSSEGLKIVLDDMVEEAHCEVLFHTLVGAVRTEGKQIAGLKVCNRDGLHTINAKVFVDATGDGDIAFWAGAQMTKGRKYDHATQPMTMNMKYCNVDTSKLKNYISLHIDEFEKLINNQDLIFKQTPFCVAGFKKELKKAQEIGEISFSREVLLFFETNQPGEYIVNTTRVQDYDSTDALSYSRAEVEGRKQCAELNKFLKKYIPGFEHAILEFTGPDMGVRESRQLVGDYTLTAEDILECRKFDSIITHSSYPIDIHSPEKGGGTDTVFLSNPESYYSIPYEVMTCPQFTNLLVTGRCISATFEAQAAIRVTPTVGAIGHACGVAAAFSSLGNIDVHKIRIKELQQTLLLQGAYLEL